MGLANAGMENLLSVKGVGEAERFMDLTYATFIHDAYAAKAYRRFVEILLAAEEGASLFHCHAGKDRTGIAAAIILSILGVSWENILADYLKTNVMREAGNNVYFDTARRQGAAEASVAALEVVLTVRPEFLRRSADEASKLYGSFHGYIRDGIGVTAEETRELRRMYLV
jgi:protein-tyrosine phosphatase